MITERIIGLLMPAYKLKDMDKMAKEKIKTLRVAAIQMESRDGDIKTNLEHYSGPQNPDNSLRW